MIHFPWKRMWALPAATMINLYNRAAADRGGGWIMHLPKWRWNYPSWTRDIHSRVVVRTIHGFSIECDAFDYIGRHIIEHKDWEPLIARTLAVCARSGGDCLDVGANLGFHTLIMSQAAGPGHRIISFEPDLRNFAALTTNLRINQIANVLPVCLALSDHDGIVQMATASNTNFGLSNIRPSATGDNGNGQLAMVMRGDHLPLSEPGRAFSLVKIDAEGLETEVLRGLAGLLPQVQHLLCEISPEWTDVNAIFSTMQAAGFRHVAIPPFHEGKWFLPETRRIVGQHDALFYRTMSPELAALVE